MKSKGTFGIYATDPEKEKNGIELETEAGTFVSRRMGSSNKAYMVALEEKARQWHRVAYDRIPRDERRRIALEAFVECVLVGWKDDVTWPSKDGKHAGPEDLKAAVNEGWEETPLPFNRENALMLFTVLDDLYVRVSDAVSLPDAFRYTAREKRLGN